jgi:hypothetical protein
MDVRDSKTAAQHLREEEKSAMGCLQIRSTNGYLAMVPAGSCVIYRVIWVINGNVLK